MPGVHMLAQWRSHHSLAPSDPRPWPPAGDCGEDVTRYCPQVEPGEGRLAACLTAQQDQEVNGNTEGTHTLLC